MRRRGLQGSSNGIKIDFDGELLCFTPESSSQFKFTNDIYYSVDQEKWELLPADTYTPTLTTKVWWYANLTPYFSNGIGTFSSTGRFNASGNPRCLLVNNELVGYSFCKLFNNGINLVDASLLILDSLTLPESCYDATFDGCTSLTIAPELPATTLADWCYADMFRNCTSLTTVPELPATKLVWYCYYEMFKGCSELNYVKSHATNISALNCLNNWLSGVSDIGEFHKPADVTYPEGVSGIPENWTKHDIDYLMFEVVSDSSFKFSRVAQYSTDQINWIELPANNDTPPFSLGTKVYWKGESTPNLAGGIGTFSSTGRFNASGNPIYLSKGNKYCNFGQLFKSCVNLVDASGLILNSTTLKGLCYNSMFIGCTSLTNAPELPATTLASYCYHSMFQGCTSLTTAPELPATTLASYCYSAMFQGCSKLNYVKSYATNINANNCLINWLSGVSNKGEFHKPAGVKYEAGSGGIPSDWTVYEF